MSANSISTADVVPYTAKSSAWRTLFWGLLAAALTLVFLQTLAPVFHVDEKYNITGLGESDQKWIAYLGAKRSVDLRNTSLVLGLLGTSLGAALGLAWLAPKAILKRTFIGAMVGLGAGLVAGWVGCALQQRFAESGQITLLQVVLVQVLIFAILGICLGGLWGSFANSNLTIIERGGAGLAAGILAGIAYPILASLLFASTNIDSAIPQTLTVQVIWLAVAWLAFGYMIPAVGSR